jgi:LacI family transcriptional regulator
LTSLCANGNLNAQTVVRAGVERMVVTLKNIANKAGVDISVVSRVLNNKGDEFRISKERQDTVRKMAKTLGYVPNVSAQSMQRGSFGCAALLLSSYKDRSYLPNRILDGIHDKLEEHDLHLLLTKLPDEKPVDFSKPPKVFRTLLADGLIINYVRGLSSELEALIEKNDSPMVWINVKKAQDCVYSDSYKAACIATEKLVELGHKRIAYVDVHHPDINMPKIHYSARDRYLGYKEVIAKAGLEPLDIRTKNIDTLLSILSRSDRPTAIVSYWSTCLPPLLKAMRIAGLSIPHDLSIISLAGQSCLEDISFSSMVEPDYEIGKAAAEMLIQKIGNKAITKLPSKILDYSYLDFGTCAALN